MMSSNQHACTGSRSLHRCLDEYEAYRGLALTQGERERIVQETNERAYFLWKDECRRVGGTVHGNDLHHWFSAEMQMISELCGRSIDVTTGDTMTSESPSGTDLPARETACDSYSIGVRVEGERLSKDGSRIFLSGEDIMKPRTDENHDMDVVKVETIDLEAEEFENKLLVTDEAQTEVLAVADTVDEVTEIVTSPAFLDEFRSRFGTHAEYVILSGRSTSHGAFR